MAVSQFAQDLEEAIKSLAWRLQAHIVHANNPSALIQTLNTHLAASFTSIGATEKRLAHAGLKLMLHSQWGLGAEAPEADLSPQWDGVCQVEGNRAQLDGWLRPQFLAWAKAIGDQHPEAIVMLSAGASSPNVTLELRVAAGACLVLPQAMSAPDHHPMVLISEPILVSNGLSRVLMEVQVPSPTMLGLVRQMAHQQMPGPFQAAQAWLRALSLERSFGSEATGAHRPPRI